MNSLDLNANKYGLLWFPFCGDDALLWNSILRLVDSLIVSGYLVDGGLVVAFR